MSHTHMQQKQKAQREHRKTKPFFTAGFTMLEMIVSVGIFTVVMLIGVGSVLSMIEANRKSQTVETALNNMNFALDSISRSIRIGKAYACTGGGSGGSGDPCQSFMYTTTRAGETRDVEYSLADGRIMRSENGAAAVPITSIDLTIERLDFYVDGQSELDDRQPMVRVVISGQAGRVERFATAFSVQTAVTQRLIDRQ